MQEQLRQSLIKLQELRSGVPLYVYISGVNLEGFLKVQKDLAQVPGHQKEIDILLESTGGQADVAYRLIRTFRKKYDTVNIIVASWAKSAATLFAFGASKLVLHEYGELGPIDVQIRKDTETDPEGEWSSAVDVQSTLVEIEDKSKKGVLDMFRKLRADKKAENKEVLNIGRTQLMEMLLDYSAKFYDPLLKKIDVSELGKMARSLNEGKMYAKRILTQYGGVISEEELEKLINFLTYDCPDHGYVVDYDLLHLYLPHVIKSTESPFGADYDKELEKLSLLLMTPQGRVTGFLSDLTPKAQSGTIKSNGEKTPSTSVATTPAENNQSGGSGSRSNANAGTPNTPRNNQGSS